MDLGLERGGEHEKKKPLDGRKEAHGRGNVGFPDGKPHEPRGPPIIVDERTWDLFLCWGRLRAAIKGKSRGPPGCACQYNRAKQRASKREKKPGGRCHMGGFASRKSINVKQTGWCAVNSEEAGGVRSQTD